MYNIFIFFHLDEYELAIAQDTGAGQGDIIVDLQMDNEAARRAKMEEAEQKRAQNALPVWHQRSTISDTILVGTGDRPVDHDEQEEDDTFEDIGQDGMDADTEDCKGKSILTLLGWGKTNVDLLSLDYAKYYESLSNNTPMEGMEDEGAVDTTITYETNNTVETFEESGAEEFEEDEDIPLVSGK